MARGDIKLHTYFVLVNYFNGMFIGEDDEGNAIQVDHLEEAVRFINEPRVESFISENAGRFISKPLYIKEVKEVELLGNRHSEK